MSASYLPLYVIYENPSDFPGKFVVRKHTIIGNHTCVDLEPTTVCDTLDQARAQIPIGHVNLHRYQEDDPVIKEVWI